jgi:hypothetical protein
MRVLRMVRKLHSSKTTGVRWEMTALGMICKTMGKGIGFQEIAA